jgi:hypothetical protein
MRILDARFHMLADVVFVLAFLFGPLVFGLGGGPAIISILIAIAFLVLAATAWVQVRTESPAVSVGHGLVELGIALLLAFLPLLDGYSPGSPARRFVWIMAVVVGVVWLLTAYGRRSLVLERKMRPISEQPSSSG